jgi:hypothetical protein
VADDEFAGKRNADSASTATTTAFTNLIMDRRRPSPSDILPPAKYGHGAYPGPSATSTNPNASTSTAESSSSTFRPFPNFVDEPESYFPGSIAKLPGGGTGGEAGPFG